MGKNHRYYKIKDKKLTKNKKNSKLNKSVAFALSGIATLGAASLLAGETHDAQAMIGKSGGVTSRMITNKSPIIKPAPGLSIGTSRLLAGSKGAINSGVSNPGAGNFTGKAATSGHSTATSRVLAGSKGAINTGTVNSDGTQFQGIKGNKPSTPTITTNSTATTGSKGLSAKESTTGSSKKVTFSNKTTIIGESGSKVTPTVSTGSSSKGSLTSTGTTSDRGSLSSDASGTLKYKGNVKNKAQKFEGGSASSVQLKNPTLSEQSHSQKGNKNDFVSTTEGFYRK